MIEQVKCQICENCEEPCAKCRKEIHESWHVKGWYWVRPEECTKDCPMYNKGEALSFFVDLTKKLKNENWVCSSCGEKLNIGSPDWRFNGRNWEHHHGYPIGHVNAELVKIEDKNSN